MESPGDHFSPDTLAFMELAIQQVMTNVEALSVMLGPIGFVWRTSNLMESDEKEDIVLLQ